LHPCRATGIDLAGFEMADAYRIQVGKGVTHPVQVIVTRYLAATADNLVQPVHIIFPQSHRQAQLMHAAGRATGAQRVDGQGGISAGGRRLAHIPGSYVLLM
jgi:hypothetical protein